MDFTQRNAEIAERVRAKTQTLNEIAADYEISYQRVSQLALRKGVQRGHPRLNADKIAEALRLIQHGMPAAQAAARVGIDNTSLYNHIVAKRTGIQCSDAYNAWSDHEDQTLRRLYKQPGWSATKIAAKLVRTRNEVIGRANRLGLCTQVKHA